MFISTRLVEKKTTMAVSGGVWETINKSRKVGETFSNTLERLLRDSDNFEELRKQASKLTEQQRMILSTMFTTSILIDELLVLEAK